MVPDIIQSFRESMRRRRIFLESARDDIRSDNLNMACFSSAIALGLLVLFLLITPFVVSDWSPSPYHLAFLPILSAYTLCALLYRHFSRTKRLGTVFGVLFECVLCVCLTLIDTAGEPMAPGCFMPLTFVALPSLFVLRFSLAYSIVIGFAVLYCAAVVAWKDPFIAQYDIFQSLVGIAFSLSIAHLVMRYRIQAFETRSRLQELSMRDSIAGIYNKRTLLTVAQRTLTAAGSAPACVLIVVALDDFKDVNDGSGHIAGDAILRGMGHLLQEHFRATDIIGRFGGDEFIVLMIGAVEKKTIEAKIASLQRRFAEVGKAETGAVTTCSVGAVVSNDPNADFLSLFAQADDALYESKLAGKNCLTVHAFRPCGNGECQTLSENRERLELLRREMDLASSEHVVAHS